MLDAGRADAVAEGLGLELWSFPICAACLVEVAFALESGDERRVRAAVRAAAPSLWDEGLEWAVREALLEARDAGVPDAAEALLEVQRLGPTSRVVKAVVRRLAAQQVEEMRALPRPRASPRRS